MPEQFNAVLRAFFGRGQRCRWSVIGQGNINDTFLVHSGRGSFILQRINGEVFPDPEFVAENTAQVSSHIRDVLNVHDIAAFPEVFPTVHGQNYFKDSNGAVWRAQKYISNSMVYESLQRPEQAFEIGRCLGRFHRICKTLSPATLKETLPGFHDLPKYIGKFEEAWAVRLTQSSDDLLLCLDCVERLKEQSSFFTDSEQRGELQLAVTHGDPKVSNVLFDNRGDRALTLIDLDTVGPGLILQDLGDCLRSCSCRTKEDDSDASIACEPDLVAQAVAGYTTENALSKFEQEHLYTALLLITFELGVRFLTDYLEGNRYFKIEHSDDNLHRALVQFKLVRSIEAQQELLRTCIASAVHRSS